MSVQKPIDVMISIHCGTMLASANLLKAYLIQKGYSVFLCDQMLGGVRYRDEISFNAATCKAMIAFINKNWCASGECEYEFNIALRTFLQKRTPQIIPLLLEEFSEYDKYPTVKGVLCNLNGLPVKAADLNNSCWEKTVQSLASMGILPNQLKMKMAATSPFTEIPISALSDGKFIASGASGRIFSASYRGEKVAVKFFAPHSLSDAQTLRFKLEVVTMASLHSKYTVNLIGASTEAPNLAIVMELMEGGPLSALLESRKELEWTTRLRMLKEIAMGVQVLHTNKPIILHRDLKSFNILLDSSMHCKIADFGLAVMKETAASHSVIDSIGTVSWMAPEVLALRPKCSTKSDIYSLGIIMWEFASRCTPYIGASPAVIQSSVRNGEREQIPEGCPRGYAELIQQCWHQDPAQRPPIERIIEELKKIEQGLKPNEQAFRYKTPSFSQFSQGTLSCEKLDEYSDHQKMILLGRFTIEGDSSNTDELPRVECRQHNNHFEFIPVPGEYDAHATFFLFDTRLFIRFTEAKNPSHFPLYMRMEQCTLPYSIPKEYCVFDGKILRVYHPE